MIGYTRTDLNLVFFFDSAFLSGFSLNTCYLNIILFDREAKLDKANNALLVLVTFTPFSLSFFKQFSLSNE